MIVAAVVAAIAATAGVVFARAGGGSNPLRGASECVDPAQDIQAATVGSNASIVQPNAAADITDARLTADGHALDIRIRTAGQIPTALPTFPGFTPEQLGFHLGLSDAHDPLGFIFIPLGSPGAKVSIFDQHVKRSVIAPDLPLVSGNEVAVRVPLDTFPTALHSPFHWWLRGDSVAPGPVGDPSFRPTLFSDFCPEPDTFPRNGVNFALAPAHMALFPSSHLFGAAPSTVTTVSPSTLEEPTTTQATSGGGTGQLSTSDRLGVNGIGPVRVGMTLAEASAAAGTSISFPPGTDIRGCAVATPAAGPAGLRFMVQDGTIVRIEVVAGAIATQSGIRIGSTEQDVLRTYPGQIQVEPHPYASEVGSGAHYLVYTPRDPALQAFLVLFETDGTKVTSFRAGQADAVRATEECA